MTATTITYEPIGVIRSEFTSADEIPKQAAEAEGVTGRVELFEEYTAGLTDIDGFSHVILIYHLHQIEGTVSLAQTPFADDTARGVFATRSPQRPNEIGFAVVELDDVEGRVLTIDGVDMVDGTPVLDIKPFVPTIDSPEDCTVGWLEDDDLQRERDE